MKKILLIITVFAVSLVGKAQLIRGSIQPGSAANKADIMYLADYNPVAGWEYVNYLSISIAVPASGSELLAPVISTAGTPFSNLHLVPATPFSYVEGSERIFSWIALNLTNPAPTVWSSGNAFIGARVTFTGGTVEKVRLVDFTNLDYPDGEGGGGDNANTFFFVVTNVRDATDYDNFFYSVPGPLSITGTYANGDHWAEKVGNLALPVELLSFSGYKDGTRNQLRWSTSIESNNKGFDVLRSLDGVNYSSIGFVNSLAIGGNSSAQLNYTFADNSVSGTRQFYRLRQVDIGGAVKLSNIILIRSDKPALITIDGMFPNPATTTLNMMLSSPVKDKVSLVITDLAGKTVMLRSLNVETGSNTLPVNVSALASGTYIVKMSGSDGEVTTGKFVKQ